MESNYPIIEELFIKKRGYYIKVAYNLCKNIEQAREITSDVFYKILNYSVPLRSTYEAHGLLILMTKQLFLNKLKVLSSRTKLFIAFEQSTSFNPEYKKLDTWPIVNNLIKKIYLLPVNQRNAIKSRFFEGLTETENSIRNNIKRVSVGMTIFQGLKKIRERENPGENLTGKSIASWNSRKKPSKDAIEILELRYLGLKFKVIGEKLKLTEGQARSIYNNYKNRIKLGLCDPITLLPRGLN